MMKNVALLTWADNENYGSFLQCYALKTVIEKNNKLKIINYIPEHEKQTLFQRLKEHPFSTIKKGLKNKTAKFLGKLPEAYENQINRHKCFIGFKSKYFTFTKKCTVTNDLKILNKSFTTFVCGSDQIWNPFFFDPNFFLDFVQDKNNKIAYAPSFGIEKIETCKNINQIISLVKKINYLSCREKSGADWLSKKLNKKVPNVLDPSLLLDKNEWSIVQNKKFKSPEKYILCYFLGSNEIYINRILKFANKHNLSIVFIPVYKKDYSRPFIIYDNIGPSEFISLIANASFVCTDSFHGCCFSILFEKQFAAFLRFSRNEQNNQNARVINLLQMFKLGTVLFSKNNNLETIFNTLIEYKKVNKILSNKRKESLEYLETALLNKGNLNE